MYAVDHSENPVMSALVKERVMFSFLSHLPKSDSTDFQEDSSWKSKTADGCHQHGPKKITVVPKNLFPDSAKAASVCGNELHDFAHDFI